MANLIAEAKDFLEKAKNNQEEYKKAAAKVADAFEKVKPFLDKIRAGDFKGAEVQLTQWDDVNKTLAAAGKMDKAKYEATNGFGVDDVLKVVDVLGKVIKVGVGIAALV